MPSNVSNLKSTSGEGYEFETSVAAYFLACLLSGRIALASVPRQIRQVSFQTRALGWLFDDLLLEFDSDLHERAALSIRSNRQFSKSAAPSDLVENLWDQVIGLTSKIFDSTTDRLAIITTPLNGAAADADWLSRLARSQTSDQMLRSIDVPGFASESRRQVFKSFACPPALQAHVGSLTIPDVLQTLLIKGFDFLQSESSDEVAVISLCQSCITSGEIQEAQRLWVELNSIARELRIAGGSIGLLGLQNRLTSQFQLVPQLATSRDLRVLTEFSKAYVETGISNTVAGKLKLERSAVVGQLRSSLLESDLVILAGESGAGKSGIAKLLFEGGSFPVTIWIPPEQLQDDFRATGIRLKAHEVLRNSAVARGLLVLDGLDRLYSHHDFLRVADLIRGALEGSGNWRVLLAIQTQELDRVKRSLYKANLELPGSTKIIGTPGLDSSELVQALRSFPSLLSIVSNERTRWLIERLNYLDYAVRLTSSSHRVRVDGVLSESEFISNFWEDQIASQGIGTERAAITLATLQGNELTNETPIAATPHDVSGIERLQQLGFVRRSEATSAVRFSHEVIGDWGRRQAIAAASELNSAWALSPLWRRAMKLYCAALLEGGDLQEWVTLVRQGIANDKPDWRWAADAALDALVGMPIEVMEAVKKTLCEDKHAGLHAFLVRFQIEATRPRVASQSVMPNLEGISRVHIDTFLRDPVLRVWPPLIRFISANAIEFIEAVGADCAWICRTWVTQGRGETRKDAFEILSTLALKILLEDPYRDDGAKDVFRGILASGNVDLERVKTIVGMAVGKIAPPVENTPAPTDGWRARRAALKAHLLESSFEDEAEVGPWPCGPAYSKNASFSELIQREPSALLPLIAIDAAFAAESYLSLLIRSPGRRSRNSPLRDEWWEIEDSPWDFPPHYNKGAFSFFLAADPNVGIGLICDLANFASERWLAEVDGAHVHDDVRLKIGGLDVQLSGGRDLFFAYRDRGRTPNICVSALMALENWLNEKVDEGVDIEPFVTTIFSKSQSAMLAGVMLGVAKKNPKLFEGCLRPLLLVPKFFSWDLSHTIGGEGFQMMGWGSPQIIHNFDSARAFHLAAYRKRPLEEFAIRALMSIPALQGELESLGAELSALGNSENEPHYRRLGAQLQLKNWKVVKEAERERWEFNPPPEVQAAVDHYKKTIEPQSDLHQLPFQCSQRLESQDPLSEREIAFTQQRLGQLSEWKESQEFSDKAGEIWAGEVALSALLVLRAPGLKVTSTIKKALAEAAAHRSEEGIPTSVSAWSPDRFAARAIPALWAREPDDRTLLEAMVRLLSSPFYETSRLAMGHAASYRTELGRRFWELQHLTVQWAAFRYTSSEHHFRSIRSTNPLVGAFSAVIKKLKKWRNRPYVDEWGEEFSRRYHSWARKRGRAFSRIAKKFMASRLGPLPADWWNGYLLRGDEAARANGGSMRVAAIDMGALAAAFLWTLSRDRSDDVGAREARSLAAIGVSKMIAWSGSGRVDDTDDVDGDRHINGRDWAWHLIATAAYEQDDVRASCEMVTTLLKRGPKAKWRAITFFEAWFGLLRDDIDDSRFVSRWQELLVTLRGLPSWQYEKTKYGWELQECWSSAMGAHWTYKTVWTFEKSQVLYQMRHVYEAWQRESPVKTECIKNFLRLALTPAGVQLAIDSLSWLPDILVQNELYDPGGEINEALTELLVTLETQHPSLVRASDNKWEAFRRLVSIASDRQSQTAQVLLQGLVR